MPDSENAIDTILDRLNAGRPGEAVPLIHDHYVARDAASLPFGGEYLGPSGFVDRARCIRQAWDTPVFTLIHATVEGMHAALQMTLTASLGGKRFRMPVYEVWRFQEGKLIEATSYYYDTKCLMALAGGGHALMAISSDPFFNDSRPTRQDDALREQNHNFAKGLLAHVMVGEWDKVEPLLTDDFAVIEAPNLPFGGDHRGCAGYARLCAMVLDTWTGSDFEFLPGQSFADESRIVMIQTLRGKIGDNYLEAKACEVFEMRDGRLGRIVPFYFDVAEVAGYHELMKAGLRKR